MIEFTLNLEPVQIIKPSLTPPPPSFVLGYRRTASDSLSGRPFVYAGRLLQFRLPGASLPKTWGWEEGGGKSKMR